MPSNAFQLGKLLMSSGKVEISPENVSDDFSTIEQVSSTDALSASGNAVGDQRIVGNNLYIWNGSGWYRIALINETPTWDSGGQPSTSYILDTDSPQDATVITLAASDPDGLPIQYSYVTGGSMDSMATISQDSSVFTIVPKTVSEVGEGAELTGSITFRASDGINILPQVSSFTLNFISVVENSRYTTLLATAVDTSDNNNITDSSTNNHTITVTGDAHAGTFSPYRHGGYSTYFDGSGDDLTIADHTSFDFGTSDFTIETWFYLASDDGTYTICAQFSAGNTGGIWLGRWTSGFVFRQGGVADVITASSPPSANQWHHVAVSRSSGSTRMFIDGTQVGSTVTSDTNNYSVSAPMYIGSDSGTTDDYRLNGYLSDFRIVKGTGLYTSNFTPTTQRLTTVSGTGYSTSLLTCHLPYIADGSSNGHSITINGNTSTKPFGPYDYNEYSESDNGGSVYFDGTGDRVNAAASSTFALTGDFTVEFWLNYKGGNGYAFFWNNNSGSGNYIGYGLNTGTKNPWVWDDTNVLTTNTAITNDVWQHHALVRSGSTLKIYLDGSEIGSTTTSKQFGTGNQPLHIGWNGGNDTQNTNGYISDFRIVNGTAVYSGAFTPPSGPLTTTGGTYPSTTNVDTSITSGHTKLLLSGTDAHVIDKSQSANLKLGGTAAAVTNATNNSNISSTNAVSFDGNSDYVHVPYESIPSFGVKEFTIEGWIYMNNLSGNQIIVDKYASGNSQSFQIYYRSTGTSLTFYVGSSVLLQDPSSSTISTQTWHHFAVTRDSSGNVRLYVDGLKKAQSTSNVSFDSAINLHLGVQGSTSTNYFNGYMQDVRLSNKAFYTADDHSASSSASIKIPSAPLKG